MKRINSFTEIDFSFSVHSTATVITTVYVLPKGVIVYIDKYPFHRKIDMQVTNANYSEEDFYNESYGSHYESPEWCMKHIEYWVKQSEI